MKSSGGRLASLWALCISFFLLLATPALADLAAGESAYRAGDYSSALRELEPYARAGNARAQYILGRIYDFGSSSLRAAFPRDEEKAIYWLDLAVAQNYPPAMSHRGGIYTSSARSRSDVEKGLALLTKAAETGHVGSQFALGNLLGIISFHEFGIRKDPKRAIYWLTRAAQAGWGAYPKLAFVTCGEAKTSGRKDDLITCFSWLLVAMRDGGDEQAEKWYWELRPSVTGNDIAEATSRADDWLARYPRRKIAPD
jgi:hypothetical protein